jgi:hypothetical protein
MTRARKQTIDYFSHNCNHGRVIFIVEKHWGNDGYAVFYKMLEQLGDSEGHYLDFRKPDEWEYFLSVALVDEKKALIILDKLSEIGVIDKELWNHRIVWDQDFIDDLEDIYSRRKIERPTKPTIPSTEIPLSGTNDNIIPIDTPINDEHRIVWDQDFIDDLEDIYSRRKIERPTKPTIPSTEIPLSGTNDNIIPIDTPINDEHVNINPQSKVKESKVKKNKEGCALFVLPDYIPQETWAAYMAVRVKKKAAQTPYALNLIISELEKIKKTHNHDPVDVLNKSIKSGWIDVYPLKTEENSNGNGTFGSKKDGYPGGRYKKRVERTALDDEIDREAAALNARLYKSDA